MTRKSISVFRRIACACSGVFTIGSPMTFMDVFITTGTPVIL